MAPPPQRTRRALRFPISFSSPQFLPPNCSTAHCLERHSRFAPATHGFPNWHAPLLRHRVFPHGTEAFRPHCLVRHSAPLHHRIRAVPRLSHMAQLRGNTGRRIERQSRQLIQRQPRGALPRAKHYVSNYLPLPSQNHRPGLFLFRPPHRTASFPAVHAFVAGNSSSASVALAFSILTIEFSPVLDFSLAFGSRFPRREILFILIRHPCRAVRVFVVPGTSAACAQRLHQTGRISLVSRFKRLSVRRAIHPKGHKVFHRFPQGHYL